MRKRPLARVIVSQAEYDDVLGHKVYWESRQNCRSDRVQLGWVRGERQKTGKWVYWFVPYNGPNAAYKLDSIGELQQIVKDYPGERGTPESPADLSGDPERPGITGDNL